MKYLIYAAGALLAVWAVWYVIRHLRRQLRGDCGCGGGCGDCPHGGGCGRKK